MNISAILQRLTATKAPDQAPGCPSEARILTYIDGVLSPSDRARVEAHIAQCDDCRELVASSVRETGEARHSEPVSELEVKQQTARILAYIDLDESRKARSNRLPNAQSNTAKTGSRLTYPRLASAALVVCAVAAGALVGISPSERDTAGMAELRLAVKDERRSQALISGDLPYSAYKPTRGEKDSDDLKYQRALNKLGSADKNTDPVQRRHDRARVLLAMGGENTSKGLEILEQLVASGVQSSELLNDLGVARLQLGRYAGAVECFRKANEKSPGNTLFLFNKALAEQKAGQMDEAREDWNEFIETVSDERLKEEARFQLALIR